MCAPKSLALLGQWDRYQSTMLTSPHKGKRGRRPKYDWEAARLHVLDLFLHHGGLSADDPEWSCQADVERAIQDFFQKLIGQSPATSTVRPYAKKFMQEFMVNNSLH